MPTRMRTVLLLLSLTLAGAASAETAGHIKRVEGEVRIVRNQQAITATPGSVVLSGDRVITGADGAAGLTTTDNSLLSLGPDSHLAVDHYAYDQATRQGNMAVRFLKGSFAVVTGLIARVSPQNSRLTTATSTLGIRGTEFVVKVELPCHLEEKILAAEAAK